MSYREHHLGCFGVSARPHQNIPHGNRFGEKVSGLCSEFLAGQDLLVSRPISSEKSGAYLALQYSRMYCPGEVACAMQRHRVRDCFSPTRIVHL